MAYRLGIFTGILFGTLLLSKIRRGNHEYLSRRSDVYVNKYNVSNEILTLRISIFGGGAGIHCNPCLGLQSSALLLV